VEDFIDKTVQADKGGQAGGGGGLGQQELSALGAELA
jgi:hypothetical protein